MPRPLLPRSSNRVAIVGGGVIGLSIGWRLAAAGLEVDVFERGEPGRGASWAAAGMLAATAEAEPSEEALLPLTLASRALWPSFARELEAASGLSVGYRDEGTLVVALGRDDAERLRFTFELQRRLGLEVEWLGRDAVLEREPHLSPRVVGGFLSPQDGQVDNRLVATALIEAFRRAGGRLHARTPVEAVDIVGGRVAGVTVGGAPHVAETVVVAGGAWSRDLAGLPAAALPPVRPVKGQMLALGMDRERPLLRHVVWAPGAYLVPRGDGRLIVGATTEERGFDAALTAGGVLSLLDGAWRALPAVEELPIVEMWTGFRPGSPDDAPILGSTAVEGLVLAVGHHRNGILLTPITADAVATLVRSGEVLASIRAFTLARFQERSLS